MSTSSLLSSQTNYAPHYLILHFILASILLSSRPWKLYHRLDHNVSPRDDLRIYGPRAVSKGRITQAQLDQMIRVENCHANSMEHYPVFVAAVLMALVAGLENNVVNWLGLGYTVARVLYAVAYIFNARSRGIALLRGVCWWASNIICLRAIWVAGSALNVKAGVQDIWI